jgi:hypothetical protein
MVISFRAARNNFRLTDFDDVRQIVVANTVRDVPCLARARDHGRNQNLMLF